MRAFVALELPDPEVISRIVSLQQDLKGCGADVRLVERQNLHFTLKFLGEISEEMGKEAGRKLGELELSGCDATIMGAGVFPGVKRPNVIWVGVSAEDKEPVTQLGEAVIRALEGIGEEDRRGFQPHLTVARVRSPRNLQALSAVLDANSNTVFGRVRLAEIKLKLSVLTPRGPIYSDMGVYPLK